MRMLLVLLAVVSVVPSSFSELPIYHFKDEMVGDLIDSPRHFPFLTLARFPDEVLVYPNRKQIKKLQVDHGDIADNERRNAEFQRFYDFRKFFGDFLKIEYHEGPIVEPPSDVRMEIFKCQMRAFIIPENKLSDFANQVVLRQLESLQQQHASRGRRENRIVHRTSAPHTRQNGGGRGSEQNNQPSLTDQVTIPARQIVEDITTCEFEKFGKTGSTDYQSVANLYTGFSRYRINCFRVNDKIFVAIGLVRIVYESTQQPGSDPSGDQADLIQKYTDYLLRKEVNTHYAHYFGRSRESTDNLGVVVTTTTTTTTTTTPLPPTDARESNRRKRVQLFAYDKIIINGTLSENADKFEVNLIDSRNKEVFHISVRFNEKNGVVVFNTKEAVWGKEERQTGALPFRRNESFELQIHCRQEDYEISINHQFFAIYRYRLPLEEVREVTVTGDVVAVYIHHQFRPQSSNNLFW